MALKDYYSLSLLTKAKDITTGELSQKSALKWLSNNEVKLKKLGIFETFATPVKMQVLADEAAESLDLFNKSVANKMLSVEVDRAVASAFKSSPNFETTAKEMMSQAKGNKFAEAGLQKSFSDFLMKEAETTDTSFFQPEGRTIFKESYEKLTGLIKRYDEVFKIIY